MSRLDDLIDLMRSVHDAYLVNPARNIRLAYIHIDDLAELSLKTWLQGNVPQWSPVSHKHKNRDYFKNLRAIVQEVKQGNPKKTALSALLQSFLDRRDNRNRFFHDHNMSALTVTEEECLRSLCDLYQLHSELFPDYSDKLKSNRIAHAQVIFIRLKYAALTQERLGEFCRKGLEGIETIIRPGTPTHDWRSLYDNPDGAVAAIKTCLEDELIKCDSELQRIDDLKKRTKEHKKKQNLFTSQRDWLKNVIATFFH